VSQPSKPETFILRDKLLAPHTSPVSRYQDLFVGRRGGLHLVRYELVMLLASWLPGALGLWLRSKLYPLLLGNAGRGVLFGTNVVLRHPHKIRLGDRVVIDDNCVLDAKGTANAGITIGDDVFVGRNSILYCKDGDIVIGGETTIAFNCEIFSANRVDIGENVLMAAYSYLNGGTHASARTDIPVSKQERSGKGISVADGVWLGAGAVVLDGVSLGPGAIVAPGSVVDKDIPAHATAAGVPARITRVRERATG
jgi:acetyltransferase-like isoleucine patch superfamily enzyme